jgi:hypothetical protein
VTPPLQRRNACTQNRSAAGDEWTKLAAQPRLLRSKELEARVMSFNMKKAGEKLKISAGVAGDKMRILSQTMKEKTSNVPVSDTINPEIVQLHNVPLPPFRSFPCSFFYYCQILLIIFEKIL